MSTCLVPSGFGLALLNFIVQRASWSFWRSFAGLSRGRYTARLDVGLLHLAIPLPGRRHQRGVRSHRRKMTGQKRSHPRPERPLPCRSRTLQSLVQRLT